MYSGDALGASNFALKSFVHPLESPTWPLAYICLFPLERHSVRVRYIVIRIFVALNVRTVELRLLGPWLASIHCLVALVDSTVVVVPGDEGSRSPSYSCY